MASVSTAAATTAWLRAIEQATECLRTATNNRHDGRGGGRGRGGTYHTQRNHPNNHRDALPSVEQIAGSMEYLTQLETWIVMRSEEEWQAPPTVPPPPFMSTTTTTPFTPPITGWDTDYPPNDNVNVNVNNGGTFSGLMIPSQVTSASGTGGGGTTPSRRRTASTPSRPLFSSNNPFASIASYDDDDDDDDEEEEDSNNNNNHQKPLTPFQNPPKYNVEEEAGDLPVLHLPGGQQQQQQQWQQGMMTLLRLLIRIRTSTSDLWAYQSKGLADAHRWTEACVALVNAIAKSRQAMFLADNQISHYYFQRELQEQQQQQQGLSDANTKQLLEALQQDADIVHVAVQSVVRVKDRYQELAHKQMQKLQRILRPQWESRDEVKDRIGKDRWNNNPNPKHDYSVLREESEEELRILQEALASLDEADVEALANLAQAMKTRLIDGSGTTIGSAGYRYNGKRPEELVENPSTDIRRLEGYPDATEYDWIFTGSNPTSSVEFFEKEVAMEDHRNTTSGGTSLLKLVKLDWYYTTATIKTSMDHPRQGKTQMFAKAGVTPELFIQILEHPRVHTDGQRYQRKQQPQQQPNSSNRRNNSSNNNNQNNDSDNRGGRRGRGRGGSQRRGPSKYAGVFGNNQAAVAPAADVVVYKF